MFDTQSLVITSLIISYITQASFLSDLRLRSLLEISQFSSSSLDRNLNILERIYNMKVKITSLKTLVINLDIYIKDDVRFTFVATSRELRNNVIHEARNLVRSINDPS